LCHRPRRESFFEDISSIHIYAPGGMSPAAVRYPPGLGCRPLQAWCCQARVSTGQGGETGGKTHEGVWKDPLVPIQS